MGDILSDEKKKIFFDCDREGLVRISVYLENFDKPNTTHQSSFRKQDVPLMKAWVKEQYEKQRIKDKREERLWNLVFLIIGSAISALVSFSTTKFQLNNSSQEFQRSHRPWVSTIDEIRIMEPLTFDAISQKATIKVSFTTKNSGSSPSFQTQAIASLHIKVPKAEYSLSELFEPIHPDIENNLERGTIIVPEDLQEHKSVSIDFPYYPKVPKVKTFLIIQIIYRDEFTAKVHHTKLAWHYVINDDEKSFEPKGSIVGRFEPYGKSYAD